jgi:hypothetical protein
MACRPNPTASVDATIAMTPASPMLRALGISLSGSGIEDQLPQHGPSIPPPSALSRQARTSRDIG